MWEIWGLTCVIILIPASVLPVSVSSLGDEGVDWGSSEFLSSFTKWTDSFPLSDTLASFKNCCAKASISILLSRALTYSLRKLTSASLIEGYSFLSVYHCMICFTLKGVTFIVTSFSFCLVTSFWSSKNSFFLHHHLWYPQ